MSHNMQLEEFSLSELRRYPLPELVAIVLQSALRVEPYFAAWNPDESRQLQQTLVDALGFVQNREIGNGLDESAEHCYRVAATAAVEYRITKSEVSHRAALAGMAIHSAIDAAADYVADPTAALNNVALAIRAVQKLADAASIKDLIEDLRAMSQSDVIDGPGIEPGLVV